MHDERRGDIYNLGAGTVWTYPAGLGIPTTQVSPAYLGDKNLNSVFVAVKYEPNSNFKVINKFDWTGNHYTPTGAAAVGYFPGALGPYGAQYAAVLATQAPGVPLLDPTAVRPDAVNNSFTTPSYDKDWGDSLTATYRVSSDLSFKNILAYRASYLESADQIGGQGDLVITQATINAGVGFTQSDLGSHYAPYAIEQIERSHQWSDELQGNYNSKYLTLTAGVMYFHLTTQNGGLVGFPNDVALENIPGNSVANIPGSSPATAYNDATSVAGYVQAEGHITSQLDVVAGFRETNDAKSGSFIGYSTPVAFSYNKTLPAYSGGLNFKPTRDLMIYGKYSRAFVSGGAAGTVVFQPETARSWEAGFKSDWFDHRLRANLAVYTVSYDDLQAASAGINVGHPELGLVVVDQGNVRAKGFEFESTMVPVKGVTLGFAAGYTDVKFTYLNPGSGQGALGQPAALNNFFPTLQPKWTSTMSAEYDTPPVFGDSNMTFRLDASWRDKELTDPFLAFQQLPMYKSLLYSPATWLINGRVSLDHIKLPYGEGQIALWVKNLGNAKESVFPDIFGFLGVTEFQAARTFGLDVNFKM